MKSIHFFPLSVGPNPPISQPKRLSNVHTGIKQPSTDIASFNRSKHIEERLYKAINANSLKDVNAALKELPIDPKQRAKIINHPSETSGQTLLHRAAYLGYTSIVKTLIHHGALPGSTDNTGCTPFLVAVKHNRLPVVKIMLHSLEKKSLIPTKNLCRQVVNQPNEEGNTPLHSAVICGNPELVELLLQHGAKKSMNRTNSWGATPLHIAVGNNNTELVKLLLRHGAAGSINTFDVTGKTLFQSAIADPDCKPEIVKLLITALPKAQRKLLLNLHSKGHTPLSLLSSTHQDHETSSRNKTMAKLLMQHGAEPLPKRRRLAQDS
jgi:ankyrin repeat protein